MLICYLIASGGEGTENPRSKLRFRYPKPNDTLFSLITDSIKVMTDFKLDLSDKESLLFAQSVLDRRKDDDDTPLPFTLTSANISSLLSKLEDNAAEDLEKTPVPQNKGRPPLVEDQDHGKKVPQWTLFVNNVGKDHLILVFMPTSYQDLELLSASKEGE